MGSEMCIRDRVIGNERASQEKVSGDGHGVGDALQPPQGRTLRRLCLLYTSDAADERSSVDLGGRRIIKKKNSNKAAHVACVTTMK